MFWGGVYSQWNKMRIYDPKLKMEFNCNEQCMMYFKATLFDDTEIADKIMGSSDARQQKKYGREVKDFDVDVWEKYAFLIVERANYLKFMQNRLALQEMMADVDAGYTTFVEASPFDKIWGIGLAEDDPDCLDREKWLGKNWLGLAITSVKDRIIKELM